MKLDILKWCSVIMALGGGCLTSLNIYPANIYLMNISAFTFLIWSVLVKDMGMITMNAGFLLIYLIGLIKILL